MLGQSVHCLGARSKRYFGSFGWIQYARVGRHVSSLRRQARLLSRLSYCLRSLLIVSRVIPGIYIALALRFDYSRHVASSLKKDPDSLPTKHTPYDKPYFWTVLASYVAGLVTTVVVMHKWKAAQPALLYLSPACGM